MKKVLILSLGFALLGTGLWAQEDQAKDAPIGFSIGTEIGFGNVLAKDYVFISKDGKYATTNWLVPKIEFAKDIGKWPVEAAFGLNLGTSAPDPEATVYYTKDEEGTGYTEVPNPPTRGWGISALTFKLAYNINDMVTVSAKTDPYDDDLYGGYELNPAAQFTFGDIGLGVELPLNKIGGPFSMRVIPTVSYTKGNLELLARPYMTVVSLEDDEVGENGFMEYKSAKPDVLSKVRVEGAYTFFDKLYVCLDIDIPTIENGFKAVGLMIDPYFEYAITDALKVTLDLTFENIASDADVAFWPTLGLYYSF
jgi:hypothetical protein